MLKKGTISKVREYYLEKDDSIFLDALRKFFDQPDLDRGNQLETTPEQENLFTEWLFFDYKLKNGKTMLEDFYSVNPWNLSKEELSTYKDLQTNIYGMYEVEKVHIGQGMSLRNLQTRKRYYVQEFSGTLNIKEGAVLFGRVGKVADHYELVGCDATVISVNFGQNFLRELKKVKDHFTPKTTSSLYTKERKESSLPTKDEVLKEAKEIEEAIIELLERTESDFSLEDVKDAIYNEEEQDDMMHVVAMFDRGRPDELGEVLELVTDAWNYFPHKALAGRCPMEMIKKQE